MPRLTISCQKPGVADVALDCEVDERVAADYRFCVAAAAFGGQHFVAFFTAVGPSESVVRPKKFIVFFIA